MKVTINKLCALVFAMAVSGITSAQNSETVSASESDSHWLFRLRLIDVVPNANSDTISIIGGKVKSISSSLAPELDINYFFTPFISTELILATTKHKPTAHNTSIGNVPLGSVWVLPPSLTVLYHPLKDNRVNPYIGAGINYTMFYKADSGPIANSISYSNSFGPVGQLGVDFKIADNWVLNADVKKIKMSTDAHVKALGTTLKTNVDINPWVIGVGIGYYVD